MHFKSTPKKKRQQLHECLKSLARCTLKNCNFYESLNQTVSSVSLMVWEPFQNTGGPVLQDTMLPGEARKHVPHSQYHTMSWTQPPAQASLTLHISHRAPATLPLAPSTFPSKTAVSHLPLPLPRAADSSQPCQVQFSPT